MKSSRKILRNTLKNMKNSIYDLPETLEVSGKNYLIRADFRPCIDIMMAFEDKNLQEFDKIQIMLKILFINAKFTSENLLEAAKQAIWFLNGGHDGEYEKNNPQRLYSWTKDARYIFSGVDKVLGYSCRSCQILNWWVFLAAFNDMGECAFSHIVSMRHKEKRGKLSNEERREWVENREIYSLKSVKELQAEEEILRKLNS